MLTFNEAFFRLYLIGRFRLVECRVDRKEERKEKDKKGKKCEENDF